MRGGVGGFEIEATVRREGTGQGRGDKGILFESVSWFSVFFDEP